MSAAYEGLPIFGDTTRLVAYLEMVVMGFPRYHKYAIGTDIRKLSYEILDLVREANIRINRAERLRSAMNHIQKLKSRLQVCFELKAFRNPNSFPTAIQKAESVSKQCGGWLGKCQNPGSQKPSGRVQI